MQCTRPTVNMTTLCYSWTDHVFQRFHANRTTYVFWVCHIHLYLHYVKPIKFFISVHQIDQVAIIVSINFITIVIIFISIVVVWLVLMQRTPSILALILHNEFHRRLHEFFLVKVRLIPFAVAITLGVLIVASWWSCPNSFDFFLFDKT